MFGRSTNKPPKAPAAASAPTSRKTTMNPSVIANNMNVLGNIVSDGVLDIDGCVDGNVRAHSVTVRPDGRIRGDLMAEEVYIYGTVEGLIKASNVTLYASAQVNGTIMHESLTIEDGAQVDGKLKRMERLLIEDKRGEESSGEQMRRPPVIDSMFDNDNDEPQSEAEIRVLETLRLIS